MIILAGIVFNMQFENISVSLIVVIEKINERINIMIPSSYQSPSESAYVNLSPENQETTKKQTLPDDFKFSHHDAFRAKKPSLLKRIIVVIKDIALKLLNVIRRICNCVCGLFCQKAASNNYKNNYPRECDTDIIENQNAYTSSKPSQTTPMSTTPQSNPSSIKTPSTATVPPAPQSTPSSTINITTARISPQNSPTPTIPIDAAPLKAPEETPFETVPPNLGKLLSDCVNGIKRQLSSENYTYSQEEVLKSAYEILSLVKADYSIVSSPTGNKQIKFVFPSAEALNNAKKAFEQVLLFAADWKDWQFSKDAHALTLSSSQTYFLLGFPNTVEQKWSDRFAALMSKMEADLDASKAAKNTDKPAEKEIEFKIPVSSTASTSTTTPATTATVSSISMLKTPEERLKEMNVVYDIYNARYAPRANRSCLSSYIQTNDFERHAATAKVYYNKHQLSLQDASLVAFQREPVNITTTQLYDKTKLANFIASKGFPAHTDSAFNDPTLIKSDGSSFKDLPCTVSIYSETYLWAQPGVDASKKEIGCLSVPAPALDSHYQPHYAYYMQGSALNQEKYSKEMKVLANMVVTTAIENKNTAFQGKGIKRLVIPLYGQGAFLAALEVDDRIAANKLFYANLIAQIKLHAKKLEGLEIVMSEYGPGRNDEMQSSFVDPLKDTGLNIGIINGDILKTAKEGDMIVNAWDPHSAPGNGNDADGSFDGAMGKGTAIGLTQLAWINPYISKKSDGLPVDASKYIGLPL